MQEKILIKSKKCNLRPFFMIMLIISILSCVIMIFQFYNQAESSYYWYGKTYEEHQDRGYCKPFTEPEDKCQQCYEVETYTESEFVFERLSNDIIWAFIPLGVALLISGIVWLWLHSYELVVSDKRIYGKSSWGKRVDLPMDSISAIGKTRLLKGIVVSTSSGRIRFLMIANVNDIYKSISELLIERQEQQRAANVSNNNHNHDIPDQLKKYKELLDSGIISKEEFEAKKNELLGL